MIGCLEGWYNVTFYGAKWSLREHGFVDRHTAECLTGHIPAWNLFVVYLQGGMLEYYSDVPLLFYEEKCFPEYVQLRCSSWLLGCLPIVEPERTKPQLASVVRKRFSLPNFRHFSVNRLQEEFNVTDQMRYDASLVTLAVLLFMSKNELRKVWKLMK